MKKHRIYSHLCKTLKHHSYYKSYRILLSWYLKLRFFLDQLYFYTLILIDLNKINIILIKPNFQKQNNGLFNNLWKEITENSGKTWEIELNTYKPFACGIVIHPAIDACVQLREKHNLKPEQVAKVSLKAHPLVQELTGKKTPTDGLLAKFSVFHSCAVALIYGRAGEHEYADDVVRSPLVIGVRDKVELIVDRSIHEASVDVTVETTDGQKHHIYIERAIGSLEKPMSNEQLKAKFVDQSTPILGAQKTEEAWNLSMSLAEQQDLGALLRSLTI